MLIGHQRQWQFLKKSLEIGKIPHALLFTGQEKLGKKTLAIEFTKLLAGDDVQKRQHPDFIFIAPEKKEIQISQIRDLIWRFSLKPFLSPFKVAVIDQAHCMNKEAQNCFLKTLEEPKGNSILILITEYPELLLGTIVSRCEIIKFFPAPRQDIEKYLRNQEISNKEVNKIINSCMGKPGLCIDFISDKQKLESQRKTIEDLVKIIKSPLVVRFQYAKDLSREPQLAKEALETWLRYFRELLLTKMSAKAKPDNFQFNIYSFSRAKKILHLLQKTYFLISRTNVNLRLAIESLFLEL